MKKFTYSAFAILLLATISFNVYSQNRVCAAEDEFQAQAKQDPSLLKAREDLEKYTAQYVASQANTTQGTSATPRIIPVVVHVIHDCGPENITKAQILDQIRILNLDYRKKNADTSNIPAPFKALAVDENVEFRMAQKDPSGNCTDGIDRVRSYLTTSCVPRDKVKSVAYWDSKKYLNIWLVRSIDAQGVAGTILGYAQFPGGAANTDGVVIRADYFGSIGTAASSGYAGRTATHEIGHWLNLIHIWGDAQCGNDQVSDTPTQYASSTGCPTYPRPSSCTGNGSYGDMYMNYMDYADGRCENMFSVGQGTRMDAILNSTTYRNAIWQAANLTATGTDGTPAVMCPPLPGYCVSSTRLCAGDSMIFTGLGYNADTINYSWTFTGGTPGTSTAINPMITYKTQGTYDVTLTTSNSKGTNSKTYTQLITVYGAAGINGLYQEDFETTTSFPGIDGYIENPDNSSFYKWERVTTTSLGGLVPSSGVACIRSRNSASNSAGEIDSWITPSFDLSKFINCKMSFKVAYAQNNTAVTDYLKMYLSTSCAKVWTLRFNKGGSTLATTTSLISAFVPTLASQWRLEAPSVTSFITGKSNVRFKFEFTSGGDNSVYLDEINVTGDPVGITENDLLNMDFTIIPNPASSGAYISFNTYKNSPVDVSLFDMVGQQVKTIVNKDLSTGAHGYYVDFSTMPKGIYLVRLKTGDALNVQKLIIQ